MAVRKFASAIRSKQGTAPAERSLLGATRLRRTAVTPTLPAKPELQVCKLGLTPLMREIGGIDAVVRSGSALGRRQSGSAGWHPGLCAGRRQAERAWIARWSADGRGRF